MSGLPPGVRPKAQPGGLPPGVQPKAAAAPAPESTTREDFGSGVARGATLGWGDEASGLIQAALDTYFGDNEGKSFGDRYRQHRDAARAAEERKQKRSPWAYGGGSILGGAVPAAAATGWALASRLPAAVKALASVEGLGAASGLGESKGDMTQEARPGEGLASGVKTALRDTAGGAMLATALQGAQTALAPAVPVLAQSLRNLGIRAGKRFIHGGGQIAPQKTISDEATVQALETGTILPFGTKTGAKARAEAQRETLGQELGDLLESAQAKGVKGENAERTAARMTEQEAWATLADDPEGAAWWAKQAEDIYPVAEQLSRERASGPIARYLRMRPNLPTDPRTNRAGLVQQEQMKRRADEYARKEFDRVQGQQSVAGERLEEKSHLLRAATEDAMQEQAHLAPQEAARFIPLKDLDSRAIQVDNELAKSLARAGRNHAFGLREMMMGSGTLTGMLASGHSPTASAAASATAAALSKLILGERGTSAAAQGAYQLGAHLIPWLSQRGALASALRGTAGRDVVEQASLAGGASATGQKMEQWWDAAEKKRQKGSGR